jgi:sulfopyruvate decarboxylase alpha subunit
MKASDFIDLLEKSGYNFFTGVPCSYFTEMINYFYEHRHIMHIPAVREDIAVGLAAGAYLANKCPVVYMQNSGLGYSLEAFASIHLIYKIPVLVLLSYRGPEDQNMEEHLIMGKHTEAIIQSFDIEYSLLEEKIFEPEMQSISEKIKFQKQPYFILVAKGALS